MKQKRLKKMYLKNLQQSLMKEQNLKILMLRWYQKVGKIVKIIIVKREMNREVEVTLSMQDLIRKLINKIESIMFLDNHIKPEKMKIFFTGSHITDNLKSPHLTPSLEKMGDLIITRPILKGISLKKDIIRVIDNVNLEESG